MKPLLLLLCAAVSLPAASYYLTVAGLGGDPDYEARFVKWAQDLEHELKTDPDARVIALSGSGATKQQVEQAIGKIASEANDSDIFALFLIGHGTFDGTDYKINLPGPDMTGAQLAAALNRIPAHRQLIVNMTSCSGASLASLAKKGRIVISATKSGNEKNAPVFARYWIDALHDPSADTDKKWFRIRSGSLPLRRPQNGRLFRSGKTARHRTCFDNRYR